jgi:Sodium/hydrogen exchanger family
MQFARRPICAEVQPATCPAAPRLSEKITRRIDDFVVALLLPIFFVYTGLRTNVGLLVRPELWLITPLLIAVAILDKLGGAAIAARVSGYGWKASAVIGTLMNTRGLTELIVLYLALDTEAISNTLRDARDHGRRSSSAIGWRRPRACRSSCSARRGQTDESKSVTRVAWLATPAHIRAGRDERASEGVGVGRAALDEQGPPAAGGTRPRGYRVELRALAQATLVPRLTWSSRARRIRTVVSTHGRQPRGQPLRDPARRAGWGRRGRRRG